MGVQGPDYFPDSFVYAALQPFFLHPSHGLLLDGFEIEFPGHKDYRELPIINFTYEI